MSFRLLRELDEYLSRSPAEAIHAGSVFHQQIKQALQANQSRPSEPPPAPLRSLLTRAYSELRHDNQCQVRCSALFGKCDCSIRELSEEILPALRPAVETSQPPAVTLPNDPRELLVTTARDAGFSDAQWKSMFYESGPYDITFPSYPMKQFAKLLIERLSPAVETAQPPRATHIHCANCDAEKCDGVGVAAQPPRDPSPEWPTTSETE